MLRMTNDKKAYSVRNDIGSNKGGIKTPPLKSNNNKMQMQPEL